MRIHPISIALRRLKGEKTIHGRSVFATETDAAEALVRMTGQDFGTDPTKWGEWLRNNRWVYHHSPEQHNQQKKKRG